jgi:aminoglycoside phosphotransferase (APT) family kinase protein
VDADLRCWLEAELDGPITSARRSFGGGSRETWFVEIGRPEDSRRIVVRHQGEGGAFGGTAFSLAREAVVYRALKDTGPPIADLIATAPDGETLVLERLPGTARIDDEDGPEAGRVLAGFFGALGALHRLDPSDLDLPGFTSPTSAEAHALDDLDRWRRIASANGLMSEPMIVYGFGWLQRMAPGAVSRTALVQGDTGPGNFLHEAGVVTGLVDWEFAHLGDPMDDVAWIDMRSGQRGAFADTGRRDQLYEEATGCAVDPESVRYYAAMVQLRCAVTTGAVIHRGGGALGLNAYMAPHHRFLTGLGCALADAMGFTPTTAEVPGPPTIGEGSTRAATIHDLRDELAAGTDPVAKLRIRDRLLVLEHDEAREHLSDELQSLEAGDLRATLGAGGVDADLADLASAAAGAGDHRLLDLLVRRARRRQLLWDTPAAGGPSEVWAPARSR